MSQKNQPVRIKASVIADAKKALKTLAKTPPEDFRLKEAVYQIIPEILEARASHRNDKAISEMLRSSGIQISASTLGSYVRDYLRDQKPTKTPRSPVHDAAPNKVAPEAQVGDPEGEPHTSTRIVYTPLLDAPDESVEEFAARILKRHEHEEVKETLADLEDTLEVSDAPEINDVQME